MNVVVGGYWESEGVVVEVGKVVEMVEMVEVVRKQF